VTSTDVTGRGRESHASTTIDPASVTAVPPIPAFSARTYGQSTITPLRQYRISVAELPPNVIRRLSDADLCVSDYSHIRCVVNCLELRDVTVNGMTIAI